MYQRSRWNRATAIQVHAVRPLTTLPIPVTLGYELREIPCALQRFVHRRIRVSRRILPAPRQTEHFGLPVRIDQQAGGLRLLDHPFERILGKPGRLFRVSAPYVAVDARE